MTHDTWRQATTQGAPPDSSSDRLSGPRCGFASMTFGYRDGRTRVTARLEDRMAKLRINITMSLDGYVAGPEQSRENPLGVGGEGLHEWAFATRTFRAVHGMEGGQTGLDDDRAASSIANVGAEIMGRNMFGPI